MYWGDVCHADTQFRGSQALVRGIVAFVGADMSAVYPAEVFKAPRIAWVRNGHVKLWHEFMCARFSKGTLVMLGLAASICCLKGTPDCALHILTDFRDAVTHLSPRLTDMAHACSRHAWARRVHDRCAFQRVQKGIHGLVRHQSPQHEPRRLSCSSLCSIAYSRFIIRSPLVTGASGP
jgi:hypothetical protein